MAIIKCALYHFLSNIFLTLGRKKRKKRKMARVIKAYVD